MFVDDRDPSHAQRLLAIFAMLRGPEIGALVQGGIRKPLRDHYLWCKYSGAHCLFPRFLQLRPSALTTVHRVGGGLWWNRAHF
jgi:hypothetical protein